MGRTNVIGLPVPLHNLVNYDTFPIGAKLIVLQKAKERNVAGCNKTSKVKNRTVKLSLYIYNSVNSVYRGLHVDRKNDLDRAVHHKT